MKESFCKVGAGFSYAGDNQGLPSDVDQSTDDLYEMLVQV